MVSNYERIYEEIKKEAVQVGSKLELNPEKLVQLIMQVVDIEDRDSRLGAVSRIDRKVASSIQGLATDKNKQANLPQDSVWN